MAPSSLAAQTLRELGVNLDELTSKIEGVRAQASPAENERAQRLQEVTRAKEQAIEEQRFESAAQLRDQERELQQAQARTAVEHEVLQQIRRQLGIPSQTDDPPEQHSDQS